MESTAAALTSTTAPGKVFESRAELAEHYKTQWHKYNLKRREAGLPPLLEADFEARLAAAQEAISQQQTNSKNHTSHLKKDKVNNKKQSSNNNKKQEEGGATLSSQTPAYDRIKQEQKQAQTSEEKEPELSEEKQEEIAEAQVKEEIMQLEINPRQCLFDRHISISVQENVIRMQRKYGFFVPDQEYLSDLEGLIGYCHEKIQVGRMCLYCQAAFKSGRSCQQHMVSSEHAKLRYENGVDLDEYTVFYDFTDADQEFLGSASYRAATPMAAEAAPAEKKETGAEEEWEDVSDDEEGAEADEDVDDDEMEDVYAGYEQEVAAMGLDVTPLGELIFPDGRIIGHRAFRRYYKQRTPTRDTRTSVMAARHAAGDRLYQGRVFNVSDAMVATGGTSVPASQRSIASIGRSGNGILVASGGANGSASFTQLSMYRYRAAVRKQFKGEAHANRLKERTTLPINKMDKKANRLCNGVSVAHAKR